MAEDKEGLLWPEEESQMEEGETSSCMSPGIPLCPLTHVHNPKGMNLEAGSPVILLE